MYTSTCSDDVYCSEHELIGICGIYVTFEGHICYQHICDNRMVNENCTFLFCFTYMCSNVGSIGSLQYQCSGTHVKHGMHICSGAYANTVKCICGRVPVHIVDCIEFIGGINSDIEVSYIDLN